MSSADDFRRRLALVRNALRNSAPTGGGVAPAQGPAKPPDAPGAGLIVPAARGEVLPSSFAVPPRGGAPSVTVSQKQLRAEAKRDVRLNGPRAPEPPVERPKTRGDCFGGERPCPFVSCRYHTYLDVTPAGSLVINRPDVDVAELKASCALDVADAGPATLDQVGAVMNVTRERARQFEATAIAHAEKAFVAGEVKQFRGSCKAVCALSGRQCQLPAHGIGVRHHDGRKAFHLVALPGQTFFPERERVERAARASRGEEASYV